MKKLICTVGLPYSGKTSWALTTNYPIVSPDSVRLALHGTRYIQNSEPIVWVLVEYMISSLFIAGHNTIILDATNNTQKRRDKWIEFCKNKGYEIEFNYINTNKNICLERAISNSDTEIMSIIEKQAQEKDW